MTPVKNGNQLEMPHLIETVKVKKNKKMLDPLPGNSQTKIGVDFSSLSRKNCSGKDSLNHSANKTLTSSFYKENNNEES